IMTVEMWIVWGVLFLIVAGISFYALRGAWAPAETAPQAPYRPEIDLQPSTSTDMLFEGLTPTLASLLPATADTRAVLFQELRAAGYYQTGAVSDYLALRNVLVWGSLFIAAGLALIMDAVYIPLIAVAGIVAAVLGFSVPRV